MSRALTVVVCAVVATPAFAETAYFAAVPDLPIAPGLAEAGPGLWFDDANGRILGAMARGDADPAAVRGFYLDALPALGWSLSPGAGAQGELVFLRGRERLALTISRGEHGTELVLRLFVRAAPSRRD